MAMTVQRQLLMLRSQVRTALTSGATTMMMKHVSVASLICSAGTDGTNYSNCVKKIVWYAKTCTNRAIQTRPACKTEIIEVVFTFASLSLILMNNDCWMPVVLDSDAENIIRVPPVLPVVFHFYRTTACNATHAFCSSVSPSVKRVHCDQTKETCLFQDHRCRHQSKARVRLPIGD